MALAEDVVIAMRLAVQTELLLNAEVDKPTVKTILKFAGDRVIPAVESDPHADVREQS